jgi:hypothetical protein
VIARFADPNLQLAMIDEVQRRRSSYSWVESLRERYEALAPAKPWSELQHNDCEHVPELQALAAAIEIEVADVAAIDRLTLDGDRDLYMWAYPSWWDFGDHFEIHDLTGIEQCAALDYLLLGQGLVDGASLAPLAALPRLRELHLCALCGHRDLEALLAIPSLRTLDVVNVTSSPQRGAWQALAEELARRGLDVPRTR